MNSKEFMDLSVIKDCVGYCVEAHSGVYRKFTDKEPYSNHPIRVCNRVVDLLIGSGCDSSILEGVIIAAISALYHDILEDTNIRERSLFSSLTITLYFWGYSPMATFNIVYSIQENLRVLTKRKNENYDIKLSGADYIQTLIKLCDIEDNISYIDSAFKENPEWALNYCHKKLSQLECMPSYKWGITSTLANSIATTLYRALNKYQPKSRVDITLTNEKGAHLKTLTGVEERHLNLLLKMISGGEIYGYVDYQDKSRKKIVKMLGEYHVEK